MIIGIISGDYIVSFDNEKGESGWHCKFEKWIGLRWLTLNFDACIFHRTADTTMIRLLTKFPAI